MTGTMDSGDVLAIVVTHSSPATLRACVDALTGQTRRPDRILVVDNHGTPPAADTLAPPPHTDAVEAVEVVRRPVNDGPAGGFEFGLREFLARGARWAWLLDDDVVPERDCLERLLGGTDAPVRWPRIRQATGEPHDFPGWCGVLLAREVVDAVGLPRGDFVWWAEDTEYLQRRITKAGYRAATVDDARVVHRNARNEPAMPPWKVYYQVRNTIFYRVHVQGLNHPVRLVRSLVRSLGAALLPPGPRRTRLARFLQGVADGVRGRLGLRVELPA